MDRTFKLNFIENEEFKENFNKAVKFCEEEKKKLSINTRIFLKIHNAVGGLTLSELRKEFSNVQNDDFFLELANLKKSGKVKKVRFPGYNARYYSLMGGV